MKKLILSIGLLTSLSMSAQTGMVYNWMKSVTSSSSNGIRSKAMCQDGSGNFYVAGDFTGTVTFPGQPSLVSTSGSQDVFIAMFNSSGTCVIAKQFGGAGLDYVNDIDRLGNELFYVGNVNGSNINKIKVSLTLGAASVNVPNVVATTIKAFGTQLMVGGYFNSTAVFPKSSGSITLTGAFAKESFLARMDASLLFTGASNPFLTGGDNEIVKIACLNNKVYAVGNFISAIQPFSTSATVFSRGVQDMYAVSIAVPTTPTSTCTWGNDLKRAGTDEVMSGCCDLRDMAKDITVTASGIFITGHIESENTPDFNGTTLVGEGACVVKLNYSGTSIGTVAWANMVVEPNTGSTIASSAITTDAAGNVLVVGSSANTVSYGALNFTVPTSVVNPGFFLKCNASGLGLSLEPIQRVQTNSPNFGFLEVSEILVHNCNIMTTGWYHDYKIQVGNLAPASQVNTYDAFFLTQTNRENSITLNTSICGAAPYATPLQVNATGATTYSWSPATNLSSSTIFNPLYSQASGFANTTYTVTTTGGTCPGSAIVNVTAGPSASGAANAGANTLVCPSSAYPLTSAAAVAGLTYSWAPSTFLSSASVAQPVLTTTASLALFPITYTLTVTDPCGNVSTDVMVASIDPNCPHRMINPDLLNNTLVTELYPNPANEVVNLQLAPTEQEVETTVLITDVTGRQVITTSFVGTGGVKTIDLHEQPKGVYLVTIIQCEKREVHRLILQ